MKFEKLGVLIMKRKPFMRPNKVVIGLINVCHSFVIWIAYNYLVGTTDKVK